MQKYNGFLGKTKKLSIFAMILNKGDDAAEGG